LEKDKLVITEKGFFLGGEPFYLASGAIHYFRIHESGWKRRLELMKDFGLTAVETYVAWNRHEPKEGEFNFSGMYDLAAFLELCESMDLKVLLRPSPYICSETDLGGMPSWLLKDRTMVLRANDDRFLAAVRRYYKKLCEVFVPYLSTNGGPIIMVAVENEYGYRGSDKKYLLALKKMLEENGVDVPFFTTDPPLAGALTYGTLDGCLAGVNIRSTPGEPTYAAKMLEKYHPGFPYFVGEFWSGRQAHWGEPFEKRDPKPIVESYVEALKLGYVNFYMFCGGTNFAFYNGAVARKSPFSRPSSLDRYNIQTTTYDTDALVSENGEPTEKYFLLRDELDKFLGKPVRPHIAPHYETQEIEVELTHAASLFENIDALSMTHTVESGPRYMEDFGQDFGYILYTVKPTAIKDVKSVNLRSGGVKDYALIYRNGQYIDSWIRDRTEPVTSVALDIDGTQLDILVENLGRINSGNNLADNRKGLDGFIAIDYAELHEIETRTLPMDNLSVLNYKKIEKPLSDTPTFLRGDFKAKAGVDTFLSLEGLNHGFAVINGFNVGRYLPWGPQRTLYIPGGLLKDGINTIELFELHPTGTKINLVGKPQLEMGYDGLDKLSEEPRKDRVTDMLDATKKEPKKIIDVQA